MLNRAILELNGLFNINKHPLQPSATATVEKPLKAVAPADREYVDPVLTTEDFKKTLVNYHEAVHTYNNKVKAENLDIKKYNYRIDKEIQKEPLQRQEQGILIKFYEMISPLNTWERNERIEEFNRCNRPMAKKDRLQTLKYPAQLIFTAILYDYYGQLLKRSKDREQIREHIPGLKIAGSLPHISIHTGNIIKKKISKESQAQRLNICQKTLRRQRKRLQEAGILQDYVFEGSARPVKMRINPEILSITEQFQEEKPIADNQVVKEGGRTLFPDRKESNRTSLNNSKIKANVKKHSEIRSSAKGLTSHSSFFYKTTRDQGQKNIDTGAGAAKIFTLSDFLRDKIEDPADFVENLAAHRYDKYEPLRPEILEKEVFSGALDRDEFKELVLQDFFKTAAKNWKEKTPFPGSWAKAYNTWKQEKFITHAGLSSNKHVVFSRLPELRYRLTSVGRYLKKHPDFNLLFPGDYFDTTRTTAKEGGFEYTQKTWKKHQAYLQTRKVDKQTTVATAKKRKKRLTERQKVDNHVKGYLKGKFDLQELFTKVDQIGNRELCRDLPEIIKKANLKFQLKNGK